MSRSFFTRKLSLPVRSKVFQSLVMSKLCYNVHTWAGVGPDDIPSLDTHMKPAVGAMLRGRLEETTKFRHASIDLFALCDLLPATAQIHASRLRYLARML